MSNGNDKNAESLRDKLEALYGIVRVLCASADQKHMLSNVLDSLEKWLNMSRGTIMLVSLDGEELLVEAGHGVEESRQQDVRYQKGEGITGQVLLTGEPAVIPRISEEPRFKNRLHQRGQDRATDSSFICVPIQVGNDIVGTLSVDLPFEDMGRLAENERVLSIVSSMIASNVNARRRARIERSKLEAENIRLREALGENFRPSNIIGNSRTMHEVYQRIHQVAPSDTTVLIRGESGTGKELVASAIHYASERSKGPFVRVNCAQLSENLLESELFGHERGAFTGAHQTRIGRLEEANGGTIFFDEIGDFSPAIQVKLLRVLQEREFQRVGSNKTMKADVRIIAATNRNLDEAVAKKEFREDLFYRINVFPLVLPPLRDRRDDIPNLADHFSSSFARRMRKEVKRISTTAINMMLAYHWPGNVRELENCVEHAVLLCSDGVIHGEHLPPTLQLPGEDEPKPVGSLKARVDMLERDMITDALKRTNGNVSAAARELGITGRMVRYKIEKLNIESIKTPRKR